jgi:hypothetical protein
MPQDQRTRDQLIERRDELNAQLNRVNEDLTVSLDRDPEEQAIELEQEDVSITMDDNLRAELAEIEARLAESENGG